jgi:hypothetical protein
MTQAMTAAPAAVITCAKHDNEEEIPMKIENILTEELAEIIAGLVKQGLTFKAKPQTGFTTTVWSIELTGGY